MLIETDRLIRKGYTGFALFPFIFLRKKYAKDTRIVRHEEIHLAQQRELLLVGFLLLYFMEYLYRRIQCDSWKDAYRAISFEREAYANDRNEDYLKERRLFAWKTYLRAEEGRSKDEDFRP